MPPDRFANVAADPWDIIGGHSGRVATTSNIVEVASFYFQRYESTGHGTMDLAEFGNLVYDLDLLKAQDENVTGRDDRQGQDLLATMKCSKEVRTELKDTDGNVCPELLDQFSDADQDRDGILTFDEFRTYWEKELQPKLGKFHDRYKLRAKAIGNGSFGTVKRGVFVKTDMHVAVKEIEKAGRETTIQMIHKEICLWEGLNHPHLLRLLDVHETLTRVLLITEFMKGGNLFGALAVIHKSLGRPVTERQIVGLARQIVSATAYLHKHGVVHCDLKPTNVLVLDNVEEVAKGLSIRSIASNVAGRSSWFV